MEHVRICSKTNLFRVWRYKTDVNTVDAAKNIKYGLRNWIRFSSSFNFWTPIHWAVLFVSQIVNDTKDTSGIASYEKYFFVWIWETDGNKLNGKDETKFGYKKWLFNET